MSGDFDLLAINTATGFSLHWLQRSLGWLCKTAARRNSRGDFVFALRDQESPGLRCANIGRQKRRKVGSVSRIQRLDGAGVLFVEPTISGQFVPHVLQKQRPFIGKEATVGSGGLLPLLASSRDKITKLIIRK